MTIINNEHGGVWRIKRRRRSGMAGGSIKR